MKWIKFCDIISNRDKTRHIQNSTVCVELNSVAFFQLFYYLLPFTILFRADLFCLPKNTRLIYLFFFAHTFFYSLKLTILYVKKKNSARKQFNSFSSLFNNSFRMEMLKPNIKPSKKWVCAIYYKSNVRQINGFFLSL